MKSGFRIVELRCDLEATRVTRMTSANETHRKLKLGENLPSDILSIVRSGCVFSAVDRLKLHTNKRQINALRGLNFWLAIRLNEMS